ncbi:hypothetical protein DL240_15730 [Lujinxingia litoralis]|uniref:DNA gyrase subunit A n=1 Tax=Lujinxingia litoralis TaxID=2211119 RepID=A0A328C4L0_9DELT|nr:DNA gyrase C-terminal beta-propeller domain-containing protein [Lujinxingia litoralis]RAL20765.1 hypothetical protein DL240_15730 [Lujinxingia litoralis]
MSESGAVIQALVSAAKEVEDAGQEGISEALRGQAEEAFGSVESALWAALVEATGGRRRGGRSEPTRVERVVGEAYEHPLYVETGEGMLYAMHGPDLEVGEEPELIESPEGIGEVVNVSWVGEGDSLYLFSNEGRFYGVDPRMVPLWDRRGEGRTIRDVLQLSGEERVRFLVPRRQLVNGRVVHVTAQGKGKASDGGEFDKGDGLDRSGREGFLLNEGDEAVAVMAVGRQATIFCASAQGQGIHFEAGELRSMGRKAVGVNLMKLGGADDAIVNAFEGTRVKQLAVITAQGLGKRVEFGEFRTQGRGGAGMQVLRLNAGDQVVGVVPCNPAEDLGVILSSGRVWRMPAAELALMGRSAKGGRVLELEAGEEVRGLVALPCGG